ncbi:hypothetical protein K435DRAFT_776334, partial [Dendrothele bispora CBS 962.96]
MGKAQTTEPIYTGSGVRRFYPINGKGADHTANTRIGPTKLLYIPFTSVFCSFILSLYTYSDVRRSLLIWGSRILSY